MGLIADRFLATEKLLAILHLIGAVILYFVTRATNFGAVYALMLMYCLRYFPTIALTNSLTLRQLTNAGGEFPFIRMFATIGWIVIGLTIGSMGIETTATPFLLAVRRVGGDELLLPDAAAYASRREGAEDHGGQSAGAGCAGDAAEASLLGFRGGVDSGLYPAHFLLCVYERLFERSGRRERRGQDDVGPVFGGRA